MAYRVEAENMQERYAFAKPSQASKLSYKGFDLTTNSYLAVIQTLLTDALLLTENFAKGAS